MAQQSYLLPLLFLVALSPFVSSQKPTNSVTFDPATATITITNFPLYTSEPYTCVRYCLYNDGSNDLVSSLGCDKANSCYCQLTGSTISTSRAFNSIAGCISYWCGKSHSSESSATSDIPYAQSVYLAYCTQALNADIANTQTATANATQIATASTTPTPSSSSSNPHLPLILGLSIGLGGAAVLLAIIVAAVCIYKRRKGRTLDKGDAAEATSSNGSKPGLQALPPKELDNTERDPQMEQAFSRFAE